MLLNSKATRGAHLLQLLLHRLLILARHLHFLLLLLKLELFDMRAPVVFHKLVLAVGDLSVLRLVFFVMMREVLSIIGGAISLLKTFRIDSALGKILLVLIPMRHHEVFLET